MTLTDCCMKTNTINELPEKTPKLVTAKDVAEVLAMTPRNVYNLYHDKKIPGYRLGDKSLRFRLPKVLAALEINLNE